MSVIETQIQCQSNTPRYSAQLLKHTQYMVTGTYTDAVSVTKKNTQIQCAVTETHIDIVHSHWNTHSAWSLEHTVHGLKNTDTVSDQ